MYIGYDNREYEDLEMDNMRRDAKEEREEMLLIEVVDGGTPAMIRRIEDAGFTHDPSRDYIGRTSLDRGLPIEVYVKNDGASEPIYIDIQDLPEIEE